ncbi:MAG TPA: YitT family protein [Acholeplasma sp.]|nr:YitT family protein [Acholeplasma sp.]
MLKKLSCEQRRILKEWIMIIIGAALVALPFSFLLYPNNWVIGGVGSIGVILREVLPTDSLTPEQLTFIPSLVTFIINVALVILAIIFLGKKMIIRIIVGSLLFPAYTALFTLIYNALGDDFHQKVITLDPMLITIYSSIIMGIGLGIVVKNEGTTGGTEIPQSIFFKYFHMPYSVSLIIIDGTILLFGFIVFLDLSMTLYAIIVVILSGLCMDIIVFGGYNKRAMYIITSKTEEIITLIQNEYGRGVTSLKAIGEYAKTDRKVIMVVVSSKEYNKLRTDIIKIDNHAFFYVVRASEVSGEGFSYEPKD